MPIAAASALAPEYYEPEDDIGIGDDELAAFRILLNAAQASEPESLRFVCSLLKSLLALHRDQKGLFNLHQADSMLMALISSARGLLTELAGLRGSLSPPWADDFMWRSYPRVPEILDDSYAVLVKLLEYHFRPRPMRKRRGVIAEEFRRLPWSTPDEFGGLETGVAERDPSSGNFVFRSSSHDEYVRIGARDVAGLNLLVEQQR